MGLLDGLFDSGNHESILGAIGAPIQKWTDPMAWLPGGLGDKWVDLTSHKIPEMTNRVGSKIMTPFDRIDETINPVRQIPIVDRVGDVIRDKPGDAVGMALGGYFAAPALAGAAGSGGAGAGGAAGTGGGTGAGLGGGGMGALGSGTFNTMGAYATPMMQGLGTGTAGTGMGAAGTSAATLGGSAAAASPFSAMDAMQMGQGMFGQQQRQQQQPQQMPMMGGGGGGGANMRALFSQFAPQIAPRQVSRTSGLLDKIIGGL
ncbi:hypothetical protein [Achromobacter deleyi]|uniref:hypothetical protein n=1 Tax=Achromobacter deleyi TaxID=1353891 RepID=UPI001583ECDB|nr:hypothetical protein [Achromobacter deleyi]